MNFGGVVMALNVSALENGESICSEYFLDVTPTLALINICAKDENHNPCPVINGKPCPKGVAARMERRDYLNGLIRVPVLESPVAVG